MRPYSTDSEGLSDLFVHLTNSSIQQKKPSKQFDKSISPTGPQLGSESMLEEEADADGNDIDGGEKEDKDDNENCSKVKLSEVLPILRRRGYDIQRLLNNIDTVVLKSLMCVQSRIGPQVNCFEVFGYDILIDDMLKPWLIEVNASPSMNLETPIDKEVKPRMVADALTIVDPLPFDRAYLARLLEYRNRNGFWPPAPRSNDMESKSAELPPHERDISDHFHRLLNGRVPRLYGQAPPRLGGFRQIAPGPIDSPFGRLARFHDALVKRQQRQRMLLSGNTAGVVASSPTSTATAPTASTETENAMSVGPLPSTPRSESALTMSRSESSSSRNLNQRVPVESVILNSHRIKLPAVV